MIVHASIYHGLERMHNLFTVNRFELLFFFQFVLCVLPAAIGAAVYKDVSCLLNLMKNLFYFFFSNLLIFLRAFSFGFTAIGTSSSQFV